MESVAPVPGASSAQESDRGEDFSPAFVPPNNDALVSSDGLLGNGDGDGDNDGDGDCNNENDQPERPDGQSGTAKPKSKRGAKSPPKCTQLYSDVDESVPPLHTDAELFPLYDKYMQGYYKRNSYGIIRGFMIKYRSFIERTANGNPHAIGKESIRSFWQSPEASTLNESGRRSLTAALNKMVAVKYGAFVPEILPRDEPVQGFSHASDAIVIEHRDGQLPASPRLPKWIKKLSSTRDPDPLTVTDETNARIARRTTPMTDRKGLPIVSTPPDNDGASTAEAESRIVGPAPTLPETKRLLGEESRIHIYSVDSEGTQYDAGKYTTREIEFGGGAQVFCKNYIAPRFPSCEEFRLCIMDQKGGERLHSKVKIPRPKDNVAQSIKETAETLRAEREHVLAAENARAEREHKREDRLMAAMEKFIGGGSSGGGANIARDLIQMEMARGMLQDLRGRDSGYIDTLIKKLDAMTEQSEKNVRAGAKEPSPFEQMMNFMATKRMMDEMFPARRRSSMSFDGFDDGAPPHPMPPSMFPPMLPPTASPVEDFDKMTTVIERIAPRQAPLSIQDVLAISEKMKGEGNSTNALIIQMLQNQVNDAKRDAEELRREMRDLQRNPQPTIGDQMRGFATAMSEMTKLNQMLTGGGGSSHGPMGTLEFLDSMSSKIPDMVNAFVDAKVKSEMIRQGKLPGENGDQSLVPSERTRQADEGESDEREPDEREKQRRAFLQFAEKIESATSDDEFGNAVIYLYNNLKSDAKWKRTFKGIATLAVLKNKGQIHKVVAAILNSMYENNPPDGVIDRIVDVILKNGDKIATYIGLDPAKIRTRAREIAAQRQGKATSAPVPPSANTSNKPADVVYAKPGSASQSPQATPAVVEDEYPEPGAQAVAEETAVDAEVESETVSGSDEPAESDGNEDNGGNGNGETEDESDPSDAPGDEGVMDTMGTVDTDGDVNGEVATMPTGVDQY